MSMNDLAKSYADLGRQAEALKLFEETLAMRKAKLGPDHPDTLRSMKHLADGYFNLGRHAEALKLREETLALQKAKLGPDHPDTLISRNNLASSYRAAGRTAEAIALNEENLKLRTSKFGSEHPDTLLSCNNLASSYITAGLFTRAEPILRECLAIRGRLLPDDWWTFHTRSQLGGSLLGQKKFAEAEPFILQGYEGLKAREAKIPAPSRKRLAEAAERVVKLYEAWGKPDKAAEWRRRLGPGPELPADAFARP